MSSRKPPVWKRPKTKIYDYNYNLGEHYYKPQLQHMESKYAQKAASPPRARTFAERFAADPVYGSNAGVDYRTTAERPFESTPTVSSAPRRTSLQDDMLGGFGRKPFDSAFGQDEEEFRPMRPRLNLGERLLDAAGAGGFMGRPREGIFGELGGGSAGVQEDPFDDPFFAPRKKLLPPRSADPDFMTEDPFKRRFGSLSKLDDDDDKLVRDMKRDSESVVAGFRSRMQARRQREEEANSNELESSGYESRVDKIRARAKARMSELEDDLPALALRSSSESASRARALLRDLELDDMDSSAGLSASSIGTSSKSLRITKRTIKATVETE